MNPTTKLATIIAATALVGVVAATPAHADEQQSAPDGLCYDEQERPVFDTEHRYEKETRERSRDRVADEWGAWSEWTDWPNAGPRDWGVVPSPLEGDHDGRDDAKSTFDRDYRYVIVNTRQVEVGTEVVAVEVPCPTVPTTEPPATVPPATVPTTVPDRCPPGEYPQSYEPDAPCGPDPCVGIDADTGMGTTLWMFQPCGTPVEPPPAVTVPATDTPVVAGPTLPETGAETWLMAAVAALLVTGGVSAVRFARR